MATGDLKGSLRKLDQHLRLLNYPREVDYTGLAKGDPSAFLPVVSHAFISYSSYLAEHLVGFGVELAGKNDLRFIESVYKVLRDLFHYKPILTKQQFLQFGYAERKISILCDIISFVTKKHKELSNTHKSKLQPKNKAPTNEPQLKAEKILPETPMPQPVHYMFGVPGDVLCFVFCFFRFLCKLRAIALSSLMFCLQKKPFVERHVSNTARSRSGSSSSASDAEELDSHSCASEEETVKGLMILPSLLQEAAESWKLKCLESQLMECQKKLERFSVFEERLKVLEREMAGKVIIDRKEWDNLVSRVVLLETEMVLRSRQVGRY
ncbi:CEP44 protein, partial [Atractosteus spatula]|nr:CEP44 protein [Atractosteus spatula]